MSLYNIIYLFYKRVKRFYKSVKKCLLKCCFLKKVKIVPEPKIKIIKRIVKFGCQICHNIIISSKMKCKHRFCELCVITKVPSFYFTPFLFENAHSGAFSSAKSNVAMRILNAQRCKQDCQICEMLIANTKSITL